MDASQLCGEKGEAAPWGDYFEVSFPIPKSSGSGRRNNLDPAWCRAVGDRVRKFTVPTFASSYQDINALCVKA